MFFILTYVFNKVSFKRPLGNFDKKIRVLAEKLEH